MNCPECNEIMGKTLLKNKVQYFCPNTLCKLYIGKYPNLWLVMEYHEVTHS